MRRAMAALALAVLAAGSAAAQQPPPAAGGFDASAAENRQVLPHFSYDTVEPVLARIRARSQRAGEGDGQALTVTFVNGRRAAILFGSCLGAACRAISIQAAWNPPAGATPERLAAALQAFNRRYAFARAFVAADGRLSLQRYLTADYGFIAGNLAVNLIVFTGLIDRFVAEVVQAPAPNPSS